MKKLALVEVIWEDTTGKARWVNVGEDTDYKLSIIHTVGWRIKAPRGYILLASQKDETYGSISDRTKIPRGCITSIRRIE